MLTQYGPGQPPATNGNGVEADGDDFLARERAALGDDAAQFGNTGNATMMDDGDDDLLGGGGDLMDGGAEDGGQEITEFESSFPSMDTRNDQVGRGGTITGSDMSFRPTPQPSYSGYGNVEEESEPMKQWRERRDLAISDREKISASKKEETVKEARKNIDDFYENYGQKTEKGIARTRKEAEDFLANRMNTTAGGTSWERIAKLVDLSGKGTKGGGSGTGKEKFREMLLDLRKDEKAPGATGV